MAIKCTFNSVNSSKLKEMSRTPSVYDSSGSGAVETNGGFKSQWEQLVYGITTEAGNNTGFCEHVNNINKQVHNDGRTCYDVLTDAVTKKARGIQWCDSNPTDSVCACINISKGVRHCINNPTHPGCDTLVAEYNKFPGNAQTEFDTRNFSPKCFAPDVCTQSGQYQPMQGADVCSQTIAVCQQDLNLYGDVASGALVEIDQSMRCEAKTEQAPSAGTGDTGGGGGGGGGGDEEEEGVDAYIPKSLEDLKTNRKKQLTAFGGVGSFMMMCLCLLLIIVLASKGGGRRSVRR
jgi:hypothetical protein